MAYSIHGRLSTGEVINYRKYFESLASTRAGEPRRHEIVGQVVALTAAFMVNDDVMALRLIAGNEFEVPIFYDVRTGQEQQIETSNGLFVVGTWALVNLATRIVALESKRPGVGSVLVERYLELEGRQMGFTGLRIDLNQTTTDAFDETVRRLDTIKKVAVSVTQPNLDWSDDHNAIHDYAQESGAGSATLEMIAPRGEGLSVGQGIVRDILGLSRQAISSLRNVIVTGSESGEVSDKTINLNRFQRKATVQVARGATPNEELDAIAETAVALTEIQDDLDSTD